MTTLLDVNVLIALADPLHINHDLVSEWFFSVKARSWATCPITENGFIRILSSSSYASISDGIEGIRELLTRMRSVRGHQFWADSISLCDSSLFTNLQNSKATTDLYLLGLAVQNKGKLVTLDARIKAGHVRGGHDSYLLIK